MAPFIKYTENASKAAGDVVFRFVNAAYVSRATYRTGAKHLQLVVPEPLAKNVAEIIDVYGEEADAALEVLRNLK